MAMRRFIFFAILLTSSCKLYPLYVGNPLSPALIQHGLFSPHSALFNISTGYLYTQVWDANLKASSIPDSVTLERVGDCEIHSNFATFAINILRRLELYTYLGVSKENIDWTAKMPFSSPEIKTNNHFSYSVGGKAIMLQFSQTVFSLDFQYFCLPSSNKLVPKIVSLYMPIPTGSQYLELKEWQLAGGIASKIGPITPYAGIKYSKLRLKVNSTDIPDIDFRNQRHWGVFVGGSLNFSHLLVATAEARFFDEKAVSASVMTAF